MPIQNKYFDEKDCLTNTFRNGTPEIKMTIVHLPSGLSVVKEGRASKKLQENLLADLKKKWEDKYVPKVLNKVWSMHEEPQTPDWQRA
jgi:hypothetical protein